MQALPALETDPRFPSGPWIGFFLDKRIPGRHGMELHLTFCEGALTGLGRDVVGPFLIRGKYDVSDGTCYWSKRYVTAHDVFYQGFNEGKGIWGEWELHLPTGVARGGFHIWPEGMVDPTGSRLHAEVEIPVAPSLPSKVSKPVRQPHPVGV